jgi:hypothetical protein
MSASGPPVQSYSILLLALGSCYQLDRVVAWGFHAFGRESRDKVQDTKEVVYNLVHISSRMIIIQFPHSVFTILLV